MSPLAVVDWDGLLEVIWVSFVAGVGAVAIFSLVVFSSSRAGEARRDGESPALFGLLAFAGMAAFLGLVAFGVIVILNK